MVSSPFKGSSLFSPLGCWGGEGESLEMDLAKRMCQQTSSADNGFALDTDPPQ